LDATTSWRVAILDRAATGGCADILSLGQRQRLVAHRGPTDRVQSSGEDPADVRCGAGRGAAAAVHRRRWAAPDHPDDPDRCERTRHVFSGIDWPCEVRTQFQDGNLGCKRGVGTAIDWFLSEVDAGIIVEDDCVPTMDFFRFCAELLDRYRDAAEVMMIGGHNPLHPSSTTPDANFERALFRHRFPLSRRIVTALPPHAQERFRAALYRLTAAAARGSG
jgi:hypothetical protein